MTKVRIKATPIKGHELLPGELFSTQSQEYWDRIDLRDSIGESVYIRTNTQAHSADDPDVLVYKIEACKE